MEKCKRRKANIYDLLDLIICTNIQIQKNTGTTGNEKRRKANIYDLLDPITWRPVATYDAWHTLTPALLTILTTPDPCTTCDTYDT